MVAIGDDGGGVVAQKWNQDRIGVRLMTHVTSSRSKNRVKTTY